MSSFQKRELRLQAGRFGGSQAERADRLEQLVGLGAIFGVEDGQVGAARLHDPVHRDVHRVRLGLGTARRDDDHGDVRERIGGRRAQRVAGVRRIGVEAESDGARGGEGLLVVRLDQQQDVQPLARILQFADPRHQVAQHVRFLVDRKQHRVIGEQRILGAHRDAAGRPVSTTRDHDHDAHPGYQHVEEDAASDEQGRGQAGCAEATRGEKDQQRGGERLLTAAHESRRRLGTCSAPPALRRLAWPIHPGHLHGTTKSS